MGHVQHFAEPWTHLSSAPPDGTALSRAERELYELFTAHAITAGYTVSLPRRHHAANAEFGLIGAEHMTQEALIKIWDEHGEIIFAYCHLFHLCATALPVSPHLRILTERQREALELVMMGGVNYYTGQRLDMQAIAAAAKRVGARCGFDLAHALGNVPMKLHDWGVDFACWCSYKYLNSGPGAVSGVFIHEAHLGQTDIPRFEGWWGHDKARRFLMEPDFHPIASAEAWQLSNAPVLNMAVHAVALNLFLKAGIDNLRERGDRLTAYLQAAIEDVASSTGAKLEVITPPNPADRGSQISMLAHGFGKELFDSLTSQGVVADWREPHVIRMAPVPLYNSFADLARFHAILHHSIQQSI